MSPPNTSGCDNSADLSEIEFDSGLPLVGRPSDASQSLPIRRKPRFIDGTETKTNPCFSTKTALVAIASTIFIAAILLVILDLTIFEFERSTRTKSQSHWANNVEDPEKTLFMNGSGSSDTIEIFELNPDRWKLTHLHLSHVEVSPAVLFKQLEIASWKVETIELINVTMFGRMGVGQDILLPALEQYTLEVNQAIGPLELFRLKNRNCSVEYSLYPSIANFQQKDCLRSLIFFRKLHMNHNWNIEQIHMLNTKIQITLFGQHVFAIDPIENEIFSRFEYTQEILEDILKAQESGTTSFELKKLYHFNYPFNISILSNFSDQLTELGLVIALDSNSTKSLSTTLPLLNSLTRFWISDANNRELVIDLGDIPKNLRELNFAFVDIDFKNQTTLPKFQLERLEFIHITVLNPEFLTKFNEIFDSKKVFWTGRISCDVWLNVMKMQSIEIIIFEDMASCDDVSFNSTIKNLLKRVSVDIDINESFVMKKDTTSGIWTGKNFDEDKKEAMEVYIDAGFLDEKFLKFETYGKLRYDRF